MLRLLFILAALMLLGMVFGPMRRHILRRLDITATILLIVLPLMAAGRLFYTVRQGGWEERDNIAFVVLIVMSLIGLWIGLWWLTNTLERRRPTPGGGLPLFPSGLAQRWLGLPAVPAVPAAEVERKGLGLARFTGRLWGRRRARRGARQGQSKPANSPATPAAAKTVATPAAAATTAPASRSARTTAKPRQSATARRSTTRRRSPRRRAASSSKMDDAAMTLGRIGGHLFGKAEKATRPKTSSSRRRRK